MPNTPRETPKRGDEGVWGWVAHRVTGVLIFFFLFVHVLDTALLRVSPDAYNRVIASYKNPVISVLEVILVAAVIFHALNGIRIIVIDYWPQGARHQQQLLRGVIVLWLALLVPTVYYLLKFSFLTVFGS